MILAIDVFYYEDRAKACGIIFRDWTSEKPITIISTWCSSFGPYIPGEFYKRELPCILELLDFVKTNLIDTIIIDGYVWTKNNEGEVKGGLGRHLLDYVGDNIQEIIGIAKTSFCRTSEISEKVIRGKNSTSPLYVQALRMKNSDAALKVKEMSGPNRIPDILKILDKETKKKDDY